MASAVGTSTELDVEAAQAASRIASLVEGQQQVVRILGTRAMLRFAWFLTRTTVAVERTSGLSVPQRS
jgi:hypothetical protein